MGKDTPAPLVARIVQQAAGNALFLEELIRVLAEGKGDELPETVLAMLQSRIARLSAELRRFLRAASIFGETLWRGGVSAVLGWDKASSVTESCLAELVRVEILERRRDSRFPNEEELAFRHALMREAAYGLTTEEEQRSGHLRAAEYLESVGESEPGVLIEHYRRAQEIQRTVPLYMRAGGEANRIGGLPESRQHYAAAYAALQQLPDSSANRRCKVDVLLQQVQIGMMSDNPAKNILRLDEAQALLGQLSGPGEQPVEDMRRRARVDFLYARVTHYLGRIQESLSFCQRVMPVAQALSDEKLVAMTTQAIGTVLLMQGKASACRPQLARAVALQDRIDSDYEWLRILGNHAMNLIMQGEYAEGMSLHRQAVDRAQESRHASGLSVTIAMRTFSERLCGDFLAVRDSAQLALEQIQQSGEKLLKYMMLSLSGWAHGYLGNRPEATAQRKKAEELAEELGGYAFYSDWFAAADAEIALRSRELSTAIELASRLVPRCRQEERLLALGLAEQVWGLALGYRARVRDEEAESHLAAALQVLQESGQFMGATLLRLEWAHLLHWQGATEQAAALRDQALKQLTASGCPHVVSAIDQTASRM